ncbi:Na+/H+ antiporter NhaA [Arcanobacterium hippocoleae]|uniref:Na(+)/H(+) antiporter NhaA n=1 Tax=Arcanobacterium hippocoleae TaxID=149017 RepID=A0ABU1T3T9_9ACTO|nr:Na+/H+ antiporter NhaA [Arcanobacterium hippocoleae]MDR6939890.1 NhaA family Na+:H+ antiporter [Arcanobacterium hippocoleae]
MSRQPSIPQRYRRALHNETTAGFVLILGAIIALIWANFPLPEVRSFYSNIANFHIGFTAINLNLSLGHWAADGLLAIFFFIIGLELKQEFAIGSLRDFRKALVPMIAAVFGMIGPILVYTLVQLLSQSGEYGGWAIPVATDIAFALAILGLFGKGMPPAARTFLMTLAVVDDLLGIILIAVFLSDNLNFIALGISLVITILFGILVQKRITKWYILWPLGLLAWYFMLQSGVHATISAVALGLTVPAIQTKQEAEPMTARFTHKIEFYSAGFVLPIFAFFAAGVNVIDSGGILSMVADPAAIGVYLGLPLGKLIGITGSVFVMITIFKLRLGKSLKIADIIPISLIAGIGFTVSLLIATLSYPPLSVTGAHARVAVLVGTLLSVILGGIAAKMRADHRMRKARRTEIHTSKSPTD